MIRVPLSRPPTTSDSSSSELPQETQEPDAYSYWGLNIFSRVSSLAAQAILSASSWSSTALLPHSHSSSLTSSQNSDETHSPQIPEKSDGLLEETDADSSQSGTENTRIFEQELLEILTNNAVGLHTFLDRSLAALPLKDLTSSPFFWSEATHQYVWTKFEATEGKIEELIQFTPAPFFFKLPLICRTMLQASFILNEACQDELKLVEMVKGVLTHIGDEREKKKNRNDVDKQLIYQFFLNQVFQIKGNDRLIADQLEQCEGLQDAQVIALKKLQQFPEVQKVIAQKHSTS